MQPTLPPPSHPVGLICPADMRHSTYAEYERSKYEVPEIGARRLSREADGTYGKPGHRRQRYTCLPGGGGKPHVFTELLPREESWHSSCEHCERQLERREGPKAPRPISGHARGPHVGAAGAHCLQRLSDSRDNEPVVARRLG